MTRLAEMTLEDLTALRDRTRERYDAFRARGIKLDITRGKPSSEQVDLSNALLQLPGNLDYHLADGSDARNYGGGIKGIQEARELFAPVLGALPEQVVIGNNSSLSLMHDCIVYALLKGVPGSTQPWQSESAITFLCPVPGYDRHFAICEDYGIDMVTVPMTGDGPDMDVVERLVADPAVKGMWCVPKYSNPTGETYSDETVKRLAVMATGAPDFRLFWDNAYALHNLTEPRREIANILELCTAEGNPDRAFVFGSTSKITFGGGGLGLFASSQANIDWITARMSKRSIGPDKLNQLRHVRYLKDRDGLDALMQRHRDVILPKFAIIDEIFTEELGENGAAQWTKPEGGYFISVDVVDGCARQAVQYAADLGIALVPAGATFPYGTDPDDRNIRVAPTYPQPDELKIAGEGIALSILLAVAEKTLAERAQDAA